MSYEDASMQDNIVNNGVIQPIDTVLMPPAPYLTAETLAQVLIKDDVKFKDILLAFMMADMINLLERNLCLFVCFLFCSVFFSTFFLANIQFLYDRGVVINKLFWKRPWWNVSERRAMTETENMSPARVPCMPPFKQSLPICMTTYCPTFLFEWV